MRTSRKRGGPPCLGFTLVEILVVLGIIAILISLLFPAMRNAIRSSKRIQCMSNQRQLATAWHMYSREFRGYMPLGWPDGGGTTSSVNYATDVQFIPWVIGDRRESNAPIYLPRNVNAHTEDWLLKAGSIYRYLRDVRIYRCPEHDPHYGLNEINISYAVNNFLHGEGAPPPKLLKLAHVRRPSMTYLTIDQIDMSKWPKEEDEASGIMYTDWAHWNIAPPGPRHLGGSCLSFVDGHVDAIRWSHSDLWGSFATHNSPQNTAANADVDMKKLTAYRGY